MARSKIRSQGVQLDEDTGAVLFSLVQGEQMQYEITLSFLTNIIGYEFECVLMEGNNTGNGKIPTTLMPSGVNTTLTVYVPPYEGVWASGTPYSKDDIVDYNDKLYIRTEGLNVVNSTTPDLSTVWKLYTNNKIYIQFSNTVIDTWSIQPSPDKNVYGFIDLRITEPVPDVGLRHTWKPLQGLVEFLFSPTHEV